MSDILYESRSMQGKETGEMAIFAIRHVLNKLRNRR
jgi:hypothetical protein